MTTTHNLEGEPSPLAHARITPSHDGPSLPEIYTQLSTYPFSSDQDFLAGLAAILGHPEIPATPDEIRSNEELVLGARCFYLSRKLDLGEPIEPDRYLEWLRSNGQSTSRQTGSELDAGVATTTNDTHASTSQVLPLPPSDSEPAPSTQEPEPPYPPSFAQIVDLITRNLPIPGIEEIPATVLEPGTSKVDNRPRRKKPWEKETLSESEGGEEGSINTSGIDASAQSEQNTNHVTLNGHASPTVGVVKILQPDAIPDNGLLSKD